MNVLTLSKHHGLGNDFLVLLDLAGRTPIDAHLARALCDRRRGLGADGLIRATRPAGDEPGALLSFELRNADGSEAEMSGNGMRCLAQAALDDGAVPAGRPFLVLTPAGPRQVTVRPTEAPGVVWAAVEMGVAKMDGEAERCNVGHGEIKVDMGNPHRRAARSRARAQRPRWAKRGVHRPRTRP
jgi:diaminopimelate epimerase